MSESGPVWLDLSAYQPTPFEQRLCAFAREQGRREVLDVVRATYAIEMSSEYGDDPDVMHARACLAAILRACGETV